jgi:hypothetical protein
MEMSVVGTRQIGEELRSPRTAEATIYGKAFVHLESATSREWDEKPVVAHLQEIAVIANAVETIAVSYEVLVNKNLVGAPKRRRNNKATTFVIESRHNDRCWVDLLRTGELQFLCGEFGMADCRGRTDSMAPVESYCMPAVRGGRSSGMCRCGGVPVVS